MQMKSTALVSQFYSTVLSSTFVNSLCANNQQAQNFGFICMPKTESPATNTEPDDDTRCHVDVWYMNIAPS